MSYSGMDTAAITKLQQIETRMWTSNLWH